MTATHNQSSDKVVVKSIMPNDIVAEKTLFDVLRDVWRAKFYMLIFVIVAVMAAFVFLSAANDFYRADMILSPATQMGIGGQVTRHVGEGSIQIQQQELESEEAFLHFETIYNGVSVASILIKDQNIIAALAQDKSFSFSKNQSPKSAKAFSEYLKKRVRLEPVSGTPLRRMTYLSTSKDNAVYMISRIHAITDEIVRGRILTSTNERIRYLNQSLSATNHPDHRRNITGLLMEQERIKMMVSLDQPFAANIVEPASVSERPKWPDPFVIYTVFILVGLLFGFVTYGLRHHD